MKTKASANPAHDKNDGKPIGDVAAASKANPIVYRLRSKNNNNVESKQANEVLQPIF